jgi:two-component system, OmpR family, response regulator ChvI
MNKVKALQDKNEISSINIVSSNKKRILLVDDEPDITLTYKMALESSGLFEVYTFNEPLKAVVNFRVHFYDLVISDIKMPNMNGFIFCRKLKEMDNNIRICFLSASEEEIYHQYNEELELACYLKKPISIIKLIKQINSILQ